MAETRKLYNERGYYAKHQGDTGNIPSDFLGLGYYRRTSLEDVINNFIVAYIGEEKALTKIPRYEVDFWAQRGLQEFSYDVLHSQKSIEAELGAAKTFPLPQDYVSIVQVSFVGDDGIKKCLLPKRSTGNPTAPLQDSNYEYTFDSNGDLQVASSSDTITRFQDENNPVNTPQSAEEYYYSNYNNDNFSYFNKRFGGNPQDMNATGYYVLSEAEGLIYFDGTFADSNVIVVDYISDGIADNGNLANVFIPKLAEDALYAYMLYNLSKLRPASAQLAPLYKKEASAKLRNAKIRLSNYNLKELAQVLRGKAKWIKH
tara:strand:+ start:1490 stop:2434 length:945 start_codon:yes stop_codon:yes gene_type:complete